MHFVCVAVPATMPEFSSSQQQLALQYVIIGLPQTGYFPGYCLSAEYTTPCNPDMDASVCIWQNVRLCSLH